MTRIVGVHGIGNYRYYRHAGSAADATAAITSDWMSWLSVNIPVELTMAYYAHHLHRGTPQGSEEDPGILEPGEQEWFVTLVEQLHPNAQVALGPRTARARQAAEWLTRRFGRTACVAAIAFCREVHTYLAHPGAVRREEARELVADAIARGRPSVVIAHSLGSVVVYEALWAHPDLQIDLLITLGSPLGMPNVVFDRLRPTPSEQSSRPPGVRYWANLDDTGDIFAIPRDLPRCFTGIDAHLPDLCIGTWDFHTVRNYLACPATHDVLRPYLLDGR